MNVKMRTAEVQINGQWCPCRLQDVAAGQVFRLREPDGVFVRWNDEPSGAELFRAASDGSVREDGVAIIDAEPA